MSSPGAAKIKCETREHCGIGGRGDGEAHLTEAAGREIMLNLNASKHKQELTDLLKRHLVAWLEPGVEIEGKIIINEGLVRFNSHFKGEVSGDGEVIVAEQGEVEADVNVKAVSVTGKLKGNVHVQDRLEIRERGMVLGNIHTPILIVEPGGYFDGECHMPAAANTATSSETRSQESK
jgi:cytoskeletal protein CcmA (bactofilin family)